LHVIANGATTELHARATLSDLLSVLGLGATWVVAERNGEAIARAAMATTVLADGDRIELVRAVAGG
jgi:sulfur carrier protein